MDGAADTRAAEGAAGTTQPDAPADAAAGREPHSSLKRAIGRNLLLALIVGDILGAGIYALVGEVAGEVGGAIWASFAVAIALAIFTACSYAELVTKYPRAAGAAIYVNRAFELPFFTFLVAFAVMSSGITSASTSARAFGGDYLAEFVSLPTVLVAIGFLLVLAAINLRGIAESVRVNLALTAVELAGLLLIVAIGIAALAGGDGEPARAFEFKEGSSVPLAILGGATLAFFALIGFEDSVNLAEEARDPRRAYPRALIGGLLIAGALYLAVAFTASMVVPTDALVESSGPLLEVVERGSSVPTDLFAAIALFALANTALINMIMASRIVYGMAREELAPRALGRVLPRRRTPWVAIALTTALALVLVTTGDLATLADTTVLLLLGVFTAVNVAVLVLRRRPVEHDHFRVPAAVPVIGAVACVGLMTQQDGEVFLRAGLLLLAGAVLWILTRVATTSTDS